MLQRPGERPRRLLHAPAGSPGGLLGVARGQVGLLVGEELERLARPLRDVHQRLGRRSRLADLDQVDRDRGHRSGSQLGEAQPGTLASGADPLGDHVDAASSPGRSRHGPMVAALLNGVLNAGDAFGICRPSFSSR